MWNFSPTQNKWQNQEINETFFPEASFVFNQCKLIHLFCQRRQIYACVTFANRNDIHGTPNRDILVFLSICGMCTVIMEIANQRSMEM